jgi:nucleoside-diphosphate-sugar epimerase
VNVFLTGATGFIGRNLALRLSEEGHEVTCLIRDSGRASWMSGSRNLIPLRGDLLDRAVLRSGVEGADVVFHLAACTCAPRRETYFRVNAEGTERVAAALLEAGRPDTKLVYVSSLSVAGPRTSSRPAVEEEPPAPISVYGRSKLEGELSLRRCGEGLRWTVIRPPVVYGPYDRDVLFLFRLARRGVLLQIGGISTETSLIHVDDLIEALLLAANRRDADGKVYYVSDGGVYSRDAIHAVFRTLTGRAVGLPVPPLLMRGLGLANDFFARLSGRPFLLNSDRVKEAIQQGWVCLPDRIRRELGFSPSITMEAGFHSTWHWYRAQNWL